MQYLTVKQVMSLLQISQKTMYRMIAGGKLPAYKLDRDWRITKEDLDQFLAERKHG